MTLKEIAREAGVSISTVSRVINSKTPKAASKATQDKIWSIAEKRGYTPNSAAQALKKGSSKNASGSVAGIIDYIISGEHLTDNDPFYLELERAIQQEAFDNRYVIRRVSLQKGAFSSHAKGVILTDNYKISANQYNILKRVYKHSIYVGINPSKYDCDQVFCNAHSISECAVKYLHSLHHTHIGYIGKPTDTCFFAGYKNSLKKCGLPFHTSSTIITGTETFNGVREAKCLLERNPGISAILCTSDTIAAEMINAFTSIEKNVPNSISVVGIGDSLLAQSISPLLTAIHIPIEELGSIALKVLLDRIHTGHRLPLKVEVPFSLTKRESVSHSRNHL